MEAGKLSLKLEKITLAPVIEDSLDAIYALADKKNIQVKVSNSLEDQCVMGDAGRLVQVLVNLLSNAIKYSPAGENVLLSVATIDDCIEIRIEDRGCGIPQKDQDKIFSRFSHIERHDLADENQAVGLGLAISKAIVEGHGGVIGFESDQGTGSAFWFRIPLIKSPDLALR